MNPTLYDILGVPSDASRDEIRKAWRESADRFEPGEGGSTKQFRLFNEAAEVLLDPERRKEYDAQLADKKAPEASTKPDAEKSAKQTADSTSSLTKASSKKADGPASETAEGPASETAEGPASETAEGPASEKADGPAELDEETGAAVAVPGPPIPGSARPTTSTIPSGGGAAPAEAAGPPASTRTVAWPVLVALGLLAAIAVGAGSYFGVKGVQSVNADRQAEAYQESLDRAPAAAENAASAVLSYDYRKLDADRDAAAKFLTKGYREEYLKTFDKTVAEAAPQLKATVEAQVLGSAPMVVGAKRDPDRVSVLVFVDQTTTSAANSESTKAMNRAQFDMVEVDGTWLVDNITSY